MRWFGPGLLKQVFSCTHPVQCNTLSWHRHISCLPVMLKPFSSHTADDDECTSSATWHQIRGNHPRLDKEKGDHHHIGI